VQGRLIPLETEHCSSLALMSSIKERLASLEASAGLLSGSVAAVTVPAARGEAVPLNVEVMTGGDSLREDSLEEAERWSVLYPDERTQAYVQAKRAAYASRLSRAQTSRLQRRGNVALSKQSSGDVVAMRQAASVKHLLANQEPTLDILSGDACPCKELSCPPGFTPLSAAFTPAPALVLAHSIVLAEAASPAMASAGAPTWLQSLGSCLQGLTASNRVTPMKRKPRGMASWKRRALLFS